MRVISYSLSKYDNHGFARLGGLSVHDIVHRDFGTGVIQFHVDDIEKIERMMDVQSFVPVLENDGFSFTGIRVTSYDIPPGDKIGYAEFSFDRIVNRLELL